jgi:hypothetical protein
MYLRNVKQILRQHRDDETSGQGQEAGFDERRYGFGGLMDLLRALQRDGFLRLERDRRGGLRVFAGANLGNVGGAQVQPREAATSHETQPGEMIDAFEDAESEQPQSELIPRDTTAELLGRANAKPKRARARTAAQAPAPRKAAVTAPKRTGARRSTRAKKPADVADHDEG